jgi:hypothetical protein
MSDITSSTIAFLAAFISFVIAFNLTWVISAKTLRRHFHTFTLSKKADWCSRVNSTLHGLVVVPGFTISVAMVSWKNSLEPASYDDLAVVHVFMAISTAYFVVDLIIILLYRVPMWMVFVTHHVVAVIPLAINVFDVDCPGGAYILALFLLVELPTLSLNMQVFLEQTGHAQTRMYATFFYITYVLWIICRCTLPAYLLVVLWNNVYPALHTTNFSCLMPGIIAAHLLTLFCFSVFIFVLTKELRVRWQKSEAMMEVAHVKPGVGDEGAMSEDLSDSLPAGGETVINEVTPQSQPEDDTPSFPHIDLRPPSAAEIDWGLGIERPPSVMRHGGSVIR